MYSFSIAVKKYPWHSYQYKIKTESKKVLKTLLTIYNCYDYFNRQICDIMECHKKVTLSNDKNMQQYAGVAKAAMSNHSHLKWRAGSSVTNKKKKAELHFNEQKLFY